MVKTLRDAGILEWEYDDDGRRRPVVNADLGEDFSIHHALSLYLLDTFERGEELQFTKENETYALDVLTMVESILENPEAILRQQLSKLKGDKVAELKAAGVEYDERMAELEKLEYPKPNREFIYGSFNLFAEKHPWIRLENIRPKSIARDMLEQVMSVPGVRARVRPRTERGRAPSLPVRRLQDARADRAAVGAGRARGRHHHDVRRHPSARSTRASSTSGSG